MKRLSLFLLTLFLALNVLSVDSARADAGHQDRHQPAYSEPHEASAGDLIFQIVHLALADHRHAGLDDCEGNCASCCATACNAMALIDLVGNSDWRLPGLPPNVVMASRLHGWDLSPPSPPPRR